MNERRTAKISVVIPTYGRPDSVIAAANSALTQALERLEVIVVDDNDDPTLSALTRRAVLSVNDERLTYLRNTRSKGGCGARNTGVLAASGEYVAFLDDDDVLLPGALRAQLKAFRGQSTGMVFGAAEVVDQVFGRTWIATPPERNVTSTTILEGFCPPTSSIVMARREALLSAGLFDEALSSFQDYDMWLRIAMGWSLESHHNVVARFVQHDGDRTSINLTRRLNGLDHLCRKWKGEIEQHQSVKSFRSLFVSQAYMVNGRLLLSAGWQKRALALRYMAFALYYAPAGRPAILARILLACAGFRITKAAGHFSDYLRSRGGPLAG